MMNEFEMIEKLVEKENVSFEEARDALRACEGDLIEAVIYLEKKGKTEEIHKMEDENRAGGMTGNTAETVREEEHTENSEEDSVRNTEACQEGEEMKEETMREETTREDTGKEETRNTGKSLNGSRIRGIFRKVRDILTNNSLSISRNEEEKVRIPAWLAAILAVFCFKFSAVVVIVSLFLGCRYAFVGKDDMSAANDLMKKAGEMAEDVKAQFN